MPAQSGPLTSSMLLNALLALLYVCDMEMRGAFSWAAHCIFILSIFPCFGGIPLGRNPHTLPQSFKVSHLFWAFCDGEDVPCLQSMWCFG